MIIKGWAPVGEGPVRGEAGAAGLADAGVRWAAGPE
jgi:hypothetical protein